MVDSDCGEGFSRFLTSFIVLPLLSGMVCSFFWWEVMLPLIAVWWIFLGMNGCTLHNDYEVAWLVLLVSFMFTTGYVIAMGVHCLAI